MVIEIRNSMTLFLFFRIEAQYAETTMDSRKIVDLAFVAADLPNEQT